MDIIVCLCSASGVNVHSKHVTDGKSGAFHAAFLFKWKRRSSTGVFPPLSSITNNLLEFPLLLSRRVKTLSLKLIRRGIAHFHLLFEDHVKIVFSRPRLQNLLHTHTHIALSYPSKPVSDSQHHQPLAIAKFF